MSDCLACLIQSDNDMCFCSPMRILRKLPPLNAQAIIPFAVSSCKNLPRDLYDKLVRHLYDESVAENLSVHVAATGLSSHTYDTTCIRGKRK